MAGGPDPPDPERGPDRRRDAVSAGMEAYLRSEAEGASEREAFAIALGRAMERYLDSLDPGERLRLLVRLHRPGVPIPEERVLPEDPQERSLALEAARRMNESGEIRRVLSASDGRAYWLRRGEDGPVSPGVQPDTLDGA